VPAEAGNTIAARIAAPMITAAKLFSFRDFLSFGCVDKHFQNAITLACPCRNSNAGAAFSTIFHERKRKKLTLLTVSSADRRETVWSLK